MKIICVIFLIALSLHTLGVQGENLVTKFDAMTKLFKKKFEEIVGGERKKMKAELHAYNLQKERMKNLTVNNDEVIQLNIGGQKMSTKRSTLRQVNGSLLATMFNGRRERKLARDKDGRVFLDFNPHHFSLILNYLRAKKIETSKHPAIIPKVSGEQVVNFNSLVVYLGLGKRLKVTDSFGLHSTGVTIQGEGRVAVKGPNRGHKYVLGKNIYRDGIIRWHLKLESFQNNHWMSVGIVKADTVPSDDTSYNWSGSYCWSLGNNYQVYTDGKMSHNAALKKASKQGDTVELILDCTTSKLSLVLSAKKKFHLSLPRSTAWKLHINLYGANDKIRIL